MACLHATSFGVQPHHCSCYISPELCYDSSFTGLPYPSANPQVSDNTIHNSTGYYLNPAVPEEIFISSDGTICLIPETVEDLFDLQNGYPIESPALPSPCFCLPSGTDAPRATGSGFHGQTVTGAIASIQPEHYPSDISHPENHVPVPATQYSQEDYQATDYPVPNHRFIYDSFPNGDQEGKREALRSVMTADWKRENKFEGHSDMLLQFMEYNTVKRRWYCSFSKATRLCNKSFKKKDQAKGHIRCHIGLKPYACQSLGPCWMSESSGTPCRKRYVAAEPLQKHRAPRVTCERCGTSMLKGNVLRHQETACRGASSQGSPGSSSCVSTPR